MLRPCFLVIDREYSGSISTRKLVIETAKFNVITAYSAKEALETLQRFPKIDGVVLDAAIKDLSCCELIRHIKEFDGSMPVITISAPGSHDCPQADHQLQSFDPARLLDLLKGLNPRSAAEIESRNEHLADNR